MASLNYFAKLTDTGDNGAGPYTLTIEKNSTTGFSGGTAITPDFGATNALGVLNPQELAYAFARAVGDNIAAANTVDTLNSTA